MKRSSTVLTLVLAGIFTLPITSNAAIVNVTVDTFTDDFTTNGNCTLREAVAAVNSGTAVDACSAGSIYTSDTNIISLPVGTYTLSLSGREEFSSLTGDLNLLRNMQITGSGIDTTIIDANNIDRAFQVQTSYPVLFSNLTIKNGETQNPGDGTTIYSGGAIKANGGDITLQNVKLTNNSSALDGGAISAKDSDLMIIDSVISNNNAGWSAGAISAYSDIDIGAGYSNVTINNSLIANNEGGFAGGIQTNRTTTHIINSTFEANQSRNEGGAFRIFYSLLTIDDSSFIGNIAKTQGGAIRDIYYSTTNINNSTFSKNKAGSGGAISADGSSYLHVNSSTITANEANTGSGIQIEGFIDRKFIKSSIVANNIGTPEISLNFVSLGNNILQENISNFFTPQPGDQLGAVPMLGSLTEYAPDKYIHPLLPGSPAIDAGNPAGCTKHDDTALSNDQTGASRIVDGDLDLSEVCDIGATEYVYTPTLVYSSISNLRITESGNTVEVQVSLTEAPSADVTANFTVSDPTEASISTSSLVFDTLNWDTPQTIIITGLDDTLDDGAVDLIIEVAALISTDPKFDSVDPIDIQVTNYDNENIGTLLLSTNHVVYENEYTENCVNAQIQFLGYPMDDFTVYLKSSDYTQGRLWHNPNSEVMINGILHQSIVMRKGTPDQQLFFSVCGVNDDEIDGDTTFDIEITTESLDQNFNGLIIPAITFTNIDNDTIIYTDGSNDTDRTEASSGSISFLALFMAILIGGLRSKNRNQ